MSFISEPIIILLVQWKEPHMLKDRIRKFEILFISLILHSTSLNKEHTKNNRDTRYHNLKSCNIHMQTCFFSYFLDKSKNEKKALNIQGVRKGREVTE